MTVVMSAITTTTMNWGYMAAYYATFRSISNTNSRLARMINYTFQMGSRYCAHPIDPGTTFFFLPLFLFTFCYSRLVSVIGRLPNLMSHVRSDTKCILRTLRTLFQCSGHLCIEYHSFATVLHSTSKYIHLFTADQTSSKL